MIRGTRGDRMSRTSATAGECVGDRSPADLFPQLRQCLTTNSAASLRIPVAASTIRRSRARRCASSCLKARAPINPGAVEFIDHQVPASAGDRSIPIQIPGRTWKNRRRRWSIFMAELSYLAVRRSMILPQSAMRRAPAAFSFRSITGSRQSIPFPAGFQDCVAALKWTSRSRIGFRHRHDTDCRRRVERRRSACGGYRRSLLATAGGPKLCFQLLVYPVLDDRMTDRSCVGPPTRRFSRATL